MFPSRLPDANDKVIGFGVEHGNVADECGGGHSSPDTFASDWIVSFPGRGVLWLNSNDSPGSDPTDLHASGWL